MTEKYDAYKNAIAALLNGTLKQEFDIARNIKDLDTRKKLTREVTDIYNNLITNASNHI
jgi:hypothetical protein